ncbi:MULTISPECIES: hypothetical protein [Colwellia]|uniref:Molecular chaperone DnaJ n=1 Tax=Colwellia marinimaniae TaxID=1513592 RepID=A0ABQ0MYJ1_9GAMM|nr:MULTISPECIES: hypothetical protein [Colwellia]GAW97443.1 molecular chaperone DnaJ [Colwellia marinimaniae]
MLSHIKEQQKNKEKPLDPLAKKWLEIEKKQKRNANFKTKTDNLYKRFQDEILPEEQEYIVLLGKETQHLMGFLSKKSLTKWQKEELHGWIEANIDLLSSHRFGDSELTQKMQEEYRDVLLASSNKMAEDEPIDPNVLADIRHLVDDMFEGEKTFSDEELSGFIRDPTRFHQVFQEFVENRTQQSNDADSDAGFDDDEMSDEEERAFYEEYARQHGHQHNSAADSEKEKQQDKLKALFNSSKLNKLYKILANRLHPDKEQNEHLKAEKSVLMAKLIKAKKDKDAFTIISMFHQFVPDRELTLFDGNDDELTQALIGLLNEKLCELDRENGDNKYNNGLQSMVWQNLGGRSKKAIQENIDTHLTDLEDDHTRLKYYIEEMKTVKVLKEVLNERYEKKRFNPFGEMSFSLDY